LLPDIFEVGRRSVLIPEWRAIETAEPWTGQESAGASDYEVNQYHPGDNGKQGKSVEIIR
jgi:hypothetical protein